MVFAGLYSILKAVTFLHEKASSSHNNLSWSAVYVTGDGSWKLGGLEYLCRYEELTADYLAKTRTTRYDKAIDPNESTNATDPKYIRSGAIDKYAFAVLVQELLHFIAKNGTYILFEKTRNDLKVFIFQMTFHLPKNLNSFAKRNCRIGT